MKWIAILVLGFSLAAAGQTAKVIALTPEDAKTAQELDQQVTTALKRQSDFREKLRLKYIGGAPAGVGLTFCLSSTGCAPTKHDWKDPKLGWENGFEFSDDWKYIVPITFRPSTSISGGGSFYGCNTLTTVPAVGIRD